MSLCNTKYNKFNFYDKSQKAKLSSSSSVERRTFFDDETGQEFKYSYQQLVEVVGEEEAKELWEGVK